MRLYQGLREVNTATKYPYYDECAKELIAIQHAIILVLLDIAVKADPDRSFMHEHLDTSHKRKLEGWV